MTQQTQSDQLCINTLRTLSIDAVQQANSGSSRDADGLGGERHIASGSAFFATIRATPNG